MMDDYLASMFIDDELDLDDKVMFVDRIHFETQFYGETRDLLEQEKLLRTQPDTTMLPDRLPVRVGAGRWLRKVFQPVVCAAAGAAAAVLLVSLLGPAAPATVSNRFVVYQPNAIRVEVAGSFTDWRPTALEPVGQSGYWAVRLPVSTGEHRFAYILDGVRRMADPTLPGREKDDFGGENSILKVDGKV